MADLRLPASATAPATVRSPSTGFEATTALYYEAVDVRLRLGEGELTAAEPAGRD